MNGDKINKYLKVSLVLLNLFVINTYVVLFSILSFGLLTPVVVGAGYKEIKNITNYDLLGMNKRFFKSIKENIKLLMGKIFFLNILFIIIALSLVFFNETIKDSYSIYFYYFTVATQWLMLFELFNIIQVSVIQIFIHNNKNINDVILKSFLIINTNVLKFLLANISIVITIVIVNKIPVLTLVFIAMNMVLYYVSISMLINNFYKNNKFIYN